MKSIACDLVCQGPRSRFIDFTHEDRTSSEHRAFRISHAITIFAIPARRGLPLLGSPGRHATLLSLLKPFKITQKNQQSTLYPQSFTAPARPSRQTAMLQPDRCRPFSNRIAAGVPSRKSAYRHSRLGERRRRRLSPPVRGSATNTTREVRGSNRTQHHAHRRSPTRRKYSGPRVRSDGKTRKRTHHRTQPTPVASRQAALPARPDGSRRRPRQAKSVRTTMPNRTLTIKET